MKRFLSFLPAFILVFGCEKETVEPVPPPPPLEITEVDSVWLDKEKAIVAVGERLALNAAYAPEDAVFNGFVWTSSDESVASVDGNGRVTGISGGFVCIKVSSASSSDSCMVLVKDPDGPQVGYYYYSDGSSSYELDPFRVPLGIIFYVNPDGKGGKILNVEEGDVLWGITGESGASDLYCGLPNTELIMQRAEWMYNYPAIGWCDNLRTSVVNWYVPAKYELQQIYAGASGMQWMENGADEFFGQIDAWEDGTAVLEDERYALSREEFNERLKMMPGGIPLTLDGHAYWSSTEIDAQEVWCASMRSGIMQSFVKDSGFGRVRAVAVF